MSGREERFTRNINHVISKELASNPNVGTYVVEDLTGIRNQRRGKTMRKWMGQWAFAQLEFMLRYKCEAKGIEVVVFDRGGYLYHGRVAELAEGAREGGLKF